MPLTDCVASQQKFLFSPLWLLEVSDQGVGRVSFSRGLSPRFTFPPWASWWLSGKESASQCRSCKRQFRSLGQEDPLEKEMATPLQYSCLENPVDRGVWQAIVQGVVRVGHDGNDLAHTSSQACHSEWLMSTVSSSS